MSQWSNCYMWKVAMCRADVYHLLCHVILSAWQCLLSNGFETTNYRNKSLRTDWRVRECCHYVRNLLKIRLPHEGEVIETSDLLEQKNLRYSNNFFGSWTLRQSKWVEFFWPANIWIFVILLYAEYRSLCLDRILKVITTAANCRIIRSCSTVSHVIFSTVLKNDETA